jgi:hypothetical protein
LNGSFKETREERNEENDDTRALDLETRNQEFLCNEANSIPFVPMVLF